VASSDLTDAEKATLFGAAENLAASNGTVGMCVAAQIAYVIMDSNGNETIGGVYEGGLMNAVGLASWQHDRLLADEDDD